MKNIIYTLLILIFGLWHIPQTVFASELRLDSNKTEVLAGEEFTVVFNAHIDGDAINALEGEIQFSPDVFSVKEISNGGSVVNFWVEHPEERVPGTISFSGVIPGGTEGINKHVFSLVFTALKEGSTTITLENVRVLLNDGVGTEAFFNSEPIAVIIKKGDDAIRKEYSNDTELPEDFTPLITSNEYLFEGAFVLIFATQDKDSGISHYEVREGKFGWYNKAESPYRLRNQRLDHTIYVKAIDNAGNERIVIVPAQTQQKFPVPYKMFAIIIVCVFGYFLFKKRWQQSLK